MFELQIKKDNLFWFSHWSIAVILYIQIINILKICVKRTLPNIVVLNDKIPFRVPIYICHVFFWLANSPSTHEQACAYSWAVVLMCNLHLMVLWLKTLRYWFRAYVSVKVQSMTSDHLSVHGFNASCMYNAHNKLTYCMSYVYMFET
jgi:hypothetical protein